MTTQPTHSEEELREEACRILYDTDYKHILEEPDYYDKESVDNLAIFIDHYTTAKINEVLDAVEELCQEAEGVNLEHNGRPDCKNCSLLENLEDKLSQIKNTHKPNVESEESL